MNFKYFLKKTIIAVLMLSLLGTQMVPAATKKQLQNQKDEAQKNLNSANKNVDAIEDEKAEAQEEVDQIDEELVELLAVMNILEEELAAKKVAVEESEKAYDEAQKVEEEQYTAMKARIRFMYEQGDSMYAEIMLHPGTFADMINKADYVEKVYDYDRVMLEDYQEAKQNAADTYEQLTEEQAELEGLQVEYKEQQTELEQTLSEKKAVVENFDEKLQAAKNEAKKYESQVKAVNTEIAKKEAEEKAAREKAAALEKARKEAEEKAKKEAASKSAKQTETGESSQEGEYKEEKSSTSSSEYSDSSEEGEYKEETQTSSSSGGSATGRAIADYACQFIGNPYVAGGTSLTNGTDCSGFTMSVYSHFGYSIPRSSSQQLSYGTGVSYSEAQPGDIMCYAGHVGIYIGNGMIVHASTPATGIKTTVATYRPILSVRRIVK